MNFFTKWEKVTPRNNAQFSFLLIDIFKSKEIIFISKSVESDKQFVFESVTHISSTSAQMLSLHCGSPPYFMYLLFQLGDDD